MSSRTLVVVIAERPALHPISALRQWAVDLGQAWKSSRRAAASALAAPVANAWRAEAALHELSALSPRLLADIGAPEALLERALRAHEMRSQCRLEAELGHRTFVDGRW